MTAHAGSVDVVHLHFGVEHLTPRRAREWVAEVRRARVGFAFTVHDLVNPHLSDQRPYDDLLDVLVPAADAVSTLSPGAAAEIHRRWGRHADIHRHPHIVDPSWLERPRSPGPSWTVGVHLKSLRANFDLDGVLSAIEAVPDLDGAVLRVHVHHDVIDPSHPRHDRRLTQILGAHGGRVDVRVHGPLEDHLLWTDLLQTDVALLPYRRGTHSGWLEMCHDLGTDVLAARVGHLHEQRTVWSYDSPADLADRLAAVRDAHRRGNRPRRPAAAVRLAEAADLARRHDLRHRDLARRMTA